MRQFTISAAALTVFAAMVVTAQAETNGGGPKQVGSQCFKYSVGNDRDGRFGSWGACPQPASAAAITQQNRRARSSR